MNKDAISNKKDFPETKNWIITLKINFMETKKITFNLNKN